MMRVVELDARHVRVRLRRPVRHASHTRQDTENLIVRCVLSDGSVGYGEGVPRDYVTGETVETALALLQRSHIPEQLEGCAAFESAVRMVDRLRLAPIPGDDRECQGNAARCAVELALLDAFGRAFGEPLSAVTKQLVPQLYKPRDRVQYSGVILSAKGWKVRAMTLGYRLTGFRQIKVKVGISGQDDVKRLRVIRRCAGAAIDLRIDANEAFAAEEAVERIRALEPFDISSVEQPVRHEEVAKLASIRRAITTAVMLDESLCSMRDAEQAVIGGWADLFNLRLSKCGGFLPTLRLAEYATQNGIGYQLGCQVGETAILSAAGRHFAASVSGIRSIEGSFDRHLLLDPLNPDDITFGRGGWAPALIGPGLGVAIDPARLEAATVRREVLLG